MLFLTVFISSCVASTQTPPAVSSLDLQQTALALEVKGIAQTQTAVLAPSSTPKHRSMVTLKCADCAADGIQINIWEFAGAFRGEVLFSLPHNTTVELVKKINADDGRVWYKILYKKQEGWVSETFIPFIP